MSEKTEREALTDYFRGDDAQLISCIKALISMSDAGALVPHGIGGHARGILSAAAVRLSRAALAPAAGEALPDEPPCVPIMGEYLTAEDGYRRGWADCAILRAAPAPIAARASEPVKVRTQAFEDCIDAIRGAIAFGQQNTNPPPDGEWLTEFWNIGRRLAAPASGEARALFTDMLQALEHVEAVYRLNVVKDSGEPSSTLDNLQRVIARAKAAPIAAAQEQARGMVGEDEPVYSNGLTFDQIADAADANEALECIEDIEPLLTWCVANVKKWNFPHWDQARKALDKLRSLLAAPLAESLQGDMAGASEPDMSAVTEDRQAVVTAERAIGDNPGTTLSIIRRMQAELDAARATPPAAGADDARERDALRFLTEEDFAVLFQFYSQAEDFEADGYTTRKEDMKRLAEIGAVNSLGFGRYAVTSFGAWLVDTAFHQSPSLPLRTVAEYNADAALRASNQGENNG